MMLEIMYAVKYKITYVIYKIKNRIPRESWQKYTVSIVGQRKPLWISSIISPSPPPPHSSSLPSNRINVTYLVRNSDVHDRKYFSYQEKLSKSIKQRESVWVPTGNLIYDKSNQIKHDKMVCGGWVACSPGKFTRFVN